MPVRIRSARAGEREEVPLLWQGCGLRRVARLVGWVGGLGFAAGGVAAMVVGGGGVAEAAGAAAAAVGGIALLGVVRCRRFEVTVSRERLEAGTGPFRRRVALGLLGPAEVGVATRWRRWYAGREVRVEVVSTGEVLRFPSDVPEELIEALGVAEESDEADLGEGR